MTHPQDTPANPAQVTDAMVEALAEFLCSEFDEDFNPCHGYSWPEHKDDDGYRGGNAYVKLQPSDVQARAREGATRILMFLSQRAALTAAIGAGGQAVAFPEKPTQAMRIAYDELNNSLGLDRFVNFDLVWEKILSHLPTHPAPSGQAVAYGDGYCTDCGCRTSVHNGRCSCGSGRVIMDTRRLVEKEDGR